MGEPDPILVENFKQAFRTVPERGTTRELEEERKRLSREHTIALQTLQSVNSSKLEWSLKPDSLEKTMMLDGLESQIKSRQRQCDLLQATIELEDRRLNALRYHEDLTFEDGMRVELMEHPERLGDALSALQRIDAQEQRNRKLKLTQRIADAIDSGKDTDGFLARAQRLIEADSPDANQWLIQYNDNVPSGSRLPLFKPTPPRSLESTQEAIDMLVLRDDLLEIIRLNNTWGDFDFEAALDPSSPDFERNAKILLNIIETAKANQVAKEEWEEYSRILGYHARQANATFTPPPMESGSVDRSRHLDQQASTEKIYKTAILGAGASAAYYIANAALDHKNVLLIGLADPWAGMRGGEQGSVINHPHNMIDPSQRGRTPNFEGGLAEREEFARRVEAVVKKIDHQSDGQIIKVKKQTFDGATCHVIETTKGVFFAKEVVSALGIGMQRDQFADLAPEEKWHGFDHDVRNMDTFMQRENLQRLGEKGAGHVVAVGGGNAGIDVITAIIRNSAAQIIWFIGSRGDPAFLEGTDNDVARKAFNDGKGTPNRLTVVREYLPDRVEKQPNGKIKVSATAGDFFVDEVTYGVGADVGAVQSIFDQSLHSGSSGELVPIDRDQTFVLSVIEKDPQKLLDQANVSSSDRELLLQLLLDPPLDGGEATVHDTLDGMSLLMTPVPPEAFRMIGGQEMRAAKGDSAKFQSQVAATLPSNVVMGDQLTPSRARVEAVEHAMPISDEGMQLVLETGGINFITANQTVIATHLAAVYDAIPPGVADYLTAQIVVSRNAKAKHWQPLPQRPAEGEQHNLQKQREFQEEWIRRLETINKAMPSDVA